MRKVLQLVKQDNDVFGKAKCRLCGDNVRFALRHLKQKHSDLYDREATKMKMAKIMEKYFT
jgi:GTP cyclohydrolase II